MLGEKSVSSRKVRIWGGNLGKDKEFRSKKTGIKSLIFYKSLFLLPNFPLKVLSRGKDKHLRFGFYGFLGRMSYLVTVHPLTHLRQRGGRSFTAAASLHLSGFITTTTENIGVVMEAFAPLFTDDYQHDYQHHYNQNCYGDKESCQSYLILIQAGLC